MEHAIINGGAQTIVYIVPHEALHPNAISINIKRRKKVLEKLGYSVLLIGQKNTHFFSTLRAVWDHKQHVHGIIIRIDGTCELDKNTLLKLVMPKIPFIWEIHGFPEEQLTFSNNLSTRWVVWKNNLKRMVLSYLVDACIFISQELQSYAREKIYIRKTAIIPNFIETPVKNYKGKSAHILSQLSQKNTYLVLWGGSGGLPWQAVDLIQKTADAVYKQNKHIIFILVSSRYWYSVKPGNNILLLHSLSEERFRYLISISHICLALYRAPSFFPFYFCPMKILEYMAMGKPVIASKLGMVPTLVQSGYNGFLTNNTISDISTKILLIANDITLSQKFSHNAKQTITRGFTHTVARKQYRDLLNSMIL